MIIELKKLKPLLTPKGSGIAWFMIDYGPEADLMWVVVINDTGEIWTFSNKEVRAEKNITLGRIMPKKPYETGTVLL